MFKIEIPIETKEKARLSEAGNGLADAAGNVGKGVSASFGKLAAAVGVGTAATKALSVISESLMKTLEPLINVLKALFVVAFLPLMPLIEELTIALGNMISAMAQTLSESQKTRESNRILRAITIPKETDNMIARILKTVAGAAFDLGTVIGDVALFFINLGRDIGQFLLDKVIFPVSEFITNAIWTVLNPLMDLGIRIVTFVIEALQSTADLGERIWESIKNGLQSIANLGERIWDVIKKALIGIGDFFGGVFGGARANGGPVSSGQTYLVGERGPELFTPGTSGNITPNNQIGGNVTINVTGNNFNNEADMRKLVSMISAKLQQQGMRSIK